MTCYVKLISITLENFQAIRERTVVPLGRLTFAYGPNSAGKSSIVDALQLINDSWSGVDCTERLKRWAHRGQDGQAAASPHLQLDARFSAQARDKEGYCYAYPSSVSDYRMHQLAQTVWSDLVNSLYDVLAEADEVSLSLGGHHDQVTLSVGGIQLWEFMREGLLRQGENCYNLAHPILRDCESTVALLFSQALDKESLDAVVRNDGRPGWIRSFGSWLWAGSEYGLHAECGDAVSMAEVAVRTLHECVVVPICRAVAARPLTRVSGERRIPADEELVFGVPGLSGFADEVSYDVDETPTARLARRLLEGLSPHLVPFRDVAASLCQRQLAQEHEALLRYDLSSEAYTELGDTVNGLLREHLFLEAGYQFAVDADVTQPVSVLAGDDEECRVIGAVASWCIARLYLRDGFGRKLRLDDVGAGVAYVTPVLVALSEGGFCAVEQPELHLHPAMQAALGDVFINQMNAGTVPYVETHSEHILLRVLRRIRQAALGKSKESSLAIGPHDVVVLYFEPLNDGSTRVKHLRVTPSGDFLDRWPRGFFAERDADLFDE